MKNNCSFCNRKEVEERIIEENDNWMIIASLGQIMEGHVLLVPKTHISCMGDLSHKGPNNQTRSMFKISERLCKALSLEYQRSEKSSPYPITVFEHGIVGQTVNHAHLHFLPTTADPTKTVRRDFPESKIQRIFYEEHLQDVYKANPRPYIFWTTQRSGSMVCWNPPAPAQYMRLVMAKILGFPERGDWRNIDPDTDLAGIQSTMRKLKTRLSHPTL